jgi:twitching motility two-component system response regulator PilH
MGKVMVVDDAYSELTMMEGILRNAGYKVVTLIDGDQLEEKVAEERPDVLLLDIVMPTRTAYENPRRITRYGRTTHTRVGVVSSMNQDSDRVWGKRQGADEYLGNPFTAEQLLEAVRRFAR